jgi:hypothetical protein
MNWPERPSLAEDYFRALERRYKEFQAEAKENQIAVMRYYTPKGDEIRIANVSRYRGEETILLHGDIKGDDGTRNPCDVVVQPQNTQVLLMLIAREEPEPEVKPKPESKFNVYERPG